MRHGWLQRKQLEKNPTPNWLFDINSQSSFNKNNVLSNSIYYPGCGFDSTILHAYLGFAHSFVYVDYMTNRDEAEKILPKFSGYTLDFMKDINESEIFGSNVEPLKFRRTDFHPRLSFKFNVKIADHVKSLEEFRIRRRQNERKFCLWLIYSRKSRTNPSHGPEKFSLLYITEEAVYTYKAIYNSNNIVPLAIVIRNADIGFGGNWTLFEKYNAIFERTVLENSAGIPKYLFTDSRYDPHLKDENYHFTKKPFWRKYIKEVPNRSFLSIWTREEIY